MYGSGYGQHWRGYFVATVTGTYTFRAWGDENIAVYLAYDYGSAELPPGHPALIKTQSQQVFEDFYITDMPSAEASRTL